MATELKPTRVRKQRVTQAGELTRLREECLRHVDAKARMVQFCKISIDVLKELAASNESIDAVNNEYMNGQLTALKRVLRELGVQE